MLQVKFVFMDGHVKAMIGAEPGMAELLEPGIEPRTRPDAGDPANDWLCAWCLNRVASEKDRFSYESRSEFSFRNPEGIWFNILLFSQTIGGRQAGAPTLANTWFADHAWSFCLCDSCAMHLGWHYEGATEFVGLIRSRIVRAALMRS